MSIVTFELVLSHLRKRDFAVLSTISKGDHRGELLWFLPPPTIQLHGQAQIVDWTDEEGTDVFRRFWMGRRILKAYRESHRRGETRICFLKITPDPVVYTTVSGSPSKSASPVTSVAPKRRAVA